MKLSFLTKTVKITPILFIFIYGLMSTNLKAQHFNVVYSGNPYSPMNIIINSALLDNLLLQTGDEIAVFDVNGSGQEICVGQVTIINEFTSDTNYIIAASTDDPTTPDIQDGFILGNPIIFRYWDFSENTETVLITATFDPTLDTTYQSFGTALVELSGFSYETWTGAVDTVWNNASNWNFNSIPNLSFDILIPANPTGGHFPSISVLTAKCKNITVENNAILKIHGKLTLGYSGPPID